MISLQKISLSLYGSRQLHPSHSNAVTRHARSFAVPEVPEIVSARSLEMGIRAII
jgi:hypothetical protein